jgi:hypothetical protein
MMHLMNRPISKVCRSAASALLGSHAASGGSAFTFVLPRRGIGEYT